MADSKGLFLQEYNIAEYRYSQLFMEREYVYSYKVKWPTAKPSYQKMVTKKFRHDPLIVSQTQEGEAILYDFDGGMALLEIEPKLVRVEIASPDNTKTNAHITNLKKVFKPAVDSTDKVKVRFWYNTTHGPVNVSRQIVVPNWESISKNYNKQTLNGLNYLINDFKPSGGGQLLIFHGLPGTGKSYSLRALIDAWKDWAVAEYILDPENLFSGSQGYMASLVLRGASDMYEDEEGSLVVPASEGEESSEADKWKLLILEDSGELLSSDAKSRTGQGLSRLLNLVDGLIGQGLRVLVLITTNEELEKLHPAVSREGRCAAAVKFRPLTYEESRVWLEDATGDKTIIPKGGKENYTLADLFAQTRGTRKDDRVFEDVKKQLGFSMR